MKTEKLRLPVWFWIVTIFFLLWNILGVFSFFQHTFISDEAMAQLSAPERELYSEYPLWSNVLFAIAVLFGFVGSLGLVLRKKWSKTAFVISLIAVVPQMIHNVFLTTSIKVYGMAQAITMPILVVLIAIFLVWFSNFSIQKKWIK
jgi:hypothetical protein